MRTKTKQIYFLLNIFTLNIHNLISLYCNNNILAVEIKIILITIIVIIVEIIKLLTIVLKIIFYK